MKDIPVVFTIHNMGYQGQFSRDAMDRAGIPAATFIPGGVEFYGDVNFLKGGIVYSDYVTTVSRRYAQEIQTPEFGFGLHGVARTRGDRLVGVLNGWTTAHGILRKIRFSPRNIRRKIYPAN